MDWKDHKETGRLIHAQKLFLIPHTDKCSCLFKSMRPSSLETKLNLYNLDAKQKHEIISLCVRGHYALACTKYFEITHKTSPQKVINHPNQYFDNSFEILNKSHSSELIYKNEKENDEDDEYCNIAVEQTNIKVESIIHVINWSDDDFHEIVDQISND